LKKTIKKEYKYQDNKTKEWKVKVYESPLFNPSYTSPNSRDNMIERKLRNHATRKYPKNFNQANVKSLYEETFEEEKVYKQREIIDPEERLGIAQEEFDDNTGSQELGNETKNVKDTPKKEVGEKLIVEKDTGEIVQPEEELTTEELEEETQEDIDEIPADDDMPDFMK
jgi:hypothetical protein